MKPFQLQTVLDYRKRVQDGAEKALMMCLEQQRAIAAEQQAQQEEINRLCQECNKAKCAGVVLHEILLYEQCILDRKRRLNELAQKRSTVDAKVRQKQAEVVSARQEKRALEILKEKREEAARQKQQYEENLFLDEVAVLGFGGSR
ncbi:MAG: flagellar export protein FliJ [Thermodesulfobacteriota bacterium]